MLEYVDTLEALDKQSIIRHNTSLINKDLVIYLKLDTGSKLQTPNSKLHLPAFTFR